MSWLSRNINAHGVELARSHQPDKAESMYRTATICLLAAQTGTSRRGQTCATCLNSKKVDAEFKFDEKLDNLLTDQTCCPFTKSITR